jgi:hypothetical protein
MTAAPEHEVEAGLGDREGMEIDGGKDEVRYLIAAAAGT